MILAEILPNNQLIIEGGIVSDSVKYESIKFIFHEKWITYEKTVVFKFGEENAINVVLNSANSLCLSENECYIPFEVLNSPEFTVSVFGTRGTSRITTTRASVAVLQSGYELGDEPAEPTADEYAQIVNIMNSTQSIVESIRNDAENGVFKGEKGDKGDKGDKGEAFTYQDFTEEQLADLVGPQGPIGLQGETGPQGEKGEKDDKGDDGVTPIVDLNYNPDSQNPQSGIAIAEAIGKWETIADITIPGGFSSYSYEITEASYPDMTKIKDFYITMAVPKTNEVISGALQVQARTLVNTPVNIARFETWNHTSFNMKGFLFSKLYGDKRHNQYYGFGANAQQSMVNNSLLNSSDCASFKSINIVLSDATKTLPSGMTIKIVGCKQ